VKILKKKPQNGRRVANLPNSPHAPVVRYYRPQGADNSTSLRSKGVSQSDAGANSESFLKSILHSAGRWFGVMLIVGVLIANTGVSSFGLQIIGSEQGYRPADDYKQELQNILDSSIWYKNKLSLNSASFERQVYDRFPEVSFNSAVIPLAGRKLQVQLQFSKPLLRLIATGNKQAVLSEDGIVVRLGSAEEINASFRELPSISIPNLNFQEGDQVLTSEEAELLSLIIAEFDGSTTLRPKTDNIEYDVSKREIKVRFKDHKYYIKMSPEREARGQVGSLVATIKNFAENGLQVNEYIDVRVDGRVFVR
jgi:hypothetical protein